VKGLRKVVSFFKEWGLDSRLPQQAGRGAKLQVYVLKQDGTLLLGSLTKEGPEFVFRYDPKFVKAEGATPISAFPALDREYRSEQLWPFFQVRVPPLERQDVQDFIEERKIPRTDVLRLLGELSAKAVTSPYRFSLVGP
jgi:HipA-like protein